MEQREEFGAVAGDGDAGAVSQVLTVEESARLLRIGRSLAYQLAREYEASGGAEAARRPSRPDLPQQRRRLSGHKDPHAAALLARR